MPRKVVKGRRQVAPGQEGQEEMSKLFWFTTSAFLICMTVLLSGCEQTYDPNLPEYGFLEPTEPNWVRDFGDNERTRVIYGISKNRVFLAMVSKRLLALEQWQKKQFVFDPNTIDLSAEILKDFKVVPNEAIEVRKMGDISSRPLKNEPNEAKR